MNMLGCNCVVGMSPIIANSKCPAWCCDEAINATVYQVIWIVLLDSLSVGLLCTGIYL